ERDIILLIEDINFFFSSRRRHTRFSRDWSSDVCSSDLDDFPGEMAGGLGLAGLLLGFEGKGILFFPADAVLLRLVLGGLSHAVRSEERRVGKGGWTCGAASGYSDKHVQLLSQRRVKIRL